MNTILQPTRRALALLVASCLMGLLATAHAADFAAGSPEASVQALMVQHFKTDMALSTRSLAAKAGWLAPSLMLRLSSFLAAPGTPDEVPVLDGDPFTDSQEPPSAFAVGAARIKGQRAELFVRFESPGRVPTRVLWQLQRQGGRWRVNDLRYSDGTKLSSLVGC